jgi:hypothetical protein
MPPVLRLKILKFSNVYTHSRLRFFSIKRFKLKRAAKSAMFVGVKTADSKPLKSEDFPYLRRGMRFNRYAYKSAVLKFVSSSPHLRATYAKALSHVLKFKMSSAQNKYFCGDAALPSISSSGLLANRATRFCRSKNEYKFIKLFSLL